MAKDAPDETITIPLSLFRDMQDALTKTAASAARGSVFLGQLVTALENVQSTHSRLLGVVDRLDGELDDIRAHATRDAYQRGLVDGHRQGSDTGAAPKTSKPPGIWANPKVRAALVTLVVTVLGTATAIASHYAIAWSGP